MTAQTRTKRSAISRVLGLERHEYVAVAWSCAYFFCVLSSYYMIRPIREAMGVESGTETIPYLFTSTFFVMLLASPIFAWIASRFQRSQFLPWVYYFFAANILIFYAVFSWALANDVDFVWIGRVFFVWISVFNLFVVSLFWSFMADIYTSEQGRRLFGVISAGGGFGAAAGPLVTSLLVTEVGFQNLLPISATLLLIGVFCIYRLRRWTAADREHEHPDSAGRGKPLGGDAWSGVRQIAKSPYLLAICAMSIIASLLGTALYMFMNQFVREAAADVDAYTQIFAIIDFLTVVVSTLIQLLIVRHAVKRLGLGWTLAIMPIVSIVGFALLALNPVLIFAAVFQGLRRALGFGFAKPTSDMLYSVVTRDEKYKAKNFIDTAVYRGGDLAGTWTVKAIWALGVTGISWLMVPFAAMWSLIALWIGREYRRRDASGLYRQTSDNDQASEEKDARNQTT